MTASISSDAVVPEALEKIRYEYRRTDVPWFVGFSGGKDSSAVVKLVYQVLASLRETAVPIYLVYCDTGVEIPIIRTFVYQVLAQLSSEARERGLPIAIKIALPPIEQRFFVKVIGRGYATPTNRFRWCTDKLRVNPVRKVIADVMREAGKTSATVLLGLRLGESQQRDRTMAAHSTDDPYFQKQAGSAGVRIFTPITRFTLNHVWSVIDGATPPFAVNGKRLRVLYRAADGECPVIRDSTARPCAGNRFGCWTCTVVRRDHAVESLIAYGESNMAPLLEFRNWLATIRDDQDWREHRRRNGAVGMGPFTLAARKEILRRLLKVQRASPWTLISDEEVQFVRTLWRADA